MLETVLGKGRLKMFGQSLWAGRAMRERSGCSVWRRPRSPEDRGSLACRAFLLFSGAVDPKG